MRIYLVELAEIKKVQEPIQLVDTTSKSTKICLKSAISITKLFKNMKKRISPALTYKIQNSTLTISLTVQGFNIFSKN